MLATSGVYIIRCATTRQVYVGGSLCVGRRLVEHRRALRGGVHHNAGLQ
ncbi:MAG: GIY-YIG nuclease family protein, partial [Ktedonobacterales bacterium]